MNCSDLIDCGLPLSGFFSSSIISLAMIQKTSLSKTLVSMLLFAVFLGAGIAMFNVQQSVQAAPPRQAAIFTPTPGPDGRIIWIVGPNDTLISISLITGVSVDQIRGLNNLSSDTILLGQELVIGLAGPPEVTFTPGPSPTATAVLPTPTPRPGSGNLCVLLFNDLNGDAIRQEEEPVIPDGQISVSNRSGTVSLTAQTVAGSDPSCFSEVPEGDYNITVAIPDGYNPTTVSNYALPLRAGDETAVDFGAQANSQTLAEEPTQESTPSRSPLLGILGGVVLLAGLGLALFAGKLLKRG